MKQKLILLLVAAVFLTSCGPQIYKAANFEKIRKNQKILAILPFKATVDLKKLPKGTTVESLKESNKSTGYSVQSNIYSEFLKKISKNKYDIEFQDIDKTNAILATNKITYEEMLLKDKSELCKILGVDGVISGDIRMSQPMSEAGAIALQVLAGASGSTNKTEIALTIHNKEDGKLLWKYDYQASGRIGSSAESLTKDLMKKVAKKFPYKR